MITAVFLQKCQSHKRQRKVRNYSGLKKTKQTLFEFIGMRTGHTLEEITEMAPRDRWMTAQEMLDLGFVDEIQNIDWSKK